MPMAVSPDRRFLYAASRVQAVFGARLCDRSRHGGADAVRRPRRWRRASRTYRSTGPGASCSARRMAAPGQRQRGRQRRARGRRAAAGDPGGAQCALDPRRREQPVRLCPHAGQRPDLPVHLRCEDPAGCASNTPAVVPDEAGDRPRHFVTSADNRFLYVLSELLATVTTFALDGNTGLLTEVGVGLRAAAGHQARPGAPRGVLGAPDRRRRATRTTTSGRRTST